MHSMTSLQSDLLAGLTGTDSGYREEDDGVSYIDGPLDDRALLKSWAEAGGYPGLDNSEEEL